MFEQMLHRFLAHFPITLLIIGFGFYLVFISPYLSVFKTYTGLSYKFCLYTSSLFFFPNIFVGDELLIKLQTQKDQMLLKQHEDLMNQALVYLLVLIIVEAIVSTKLKRLVLVPALLWGILLYYLCLGAHIGGKLTLS
jgi:uncharacterized membrane protein